MAELVATNAFGLTDNDVQEVIATIADRRKGSRRPTTIPLGREGAAEDSLEAREDRRREAFDREAIPHMDSLYIHALRMTMCQADAEDLLQETYLKAFRFFDSFEAGTNCKAWLFRILKNSYINRYRRTKRTPTTVDFNEVEEYYHTIRADNGVSNDLAAEIFDNLLDDEVTDAVGKLPEEFRTAVILCDIEGFTYEEIAAVAACPVGTIRSRLHRGRRLLRESLLEYGMKRGYRYETA